MLEKPRKRRREKNSQRILDVTQKLIAKKGYENVSLREIARKADYSPAALYEYYDSKEHILAALRGRINKLMIQYVQNLPECELAHERLVEMAMAYIEFAVKHTEYFNLINDLPPMKTLLESPDPKTSPFLFFQEAVRDLLNEWEVEVQSGLGLQEITYSIWTVIHGMATLQVTHLQGFDVDFDGANRRILGFFLEGLKRHLGEQ